MLGRLHHRRRKHRKSKQIVPSSVLADIHDSFDIEDVELGSGSFSVVRPGFSKADGTKWAVKIINKKNVKNQAEMLRAEVEIMKRVKHQHVIHLMEVYEDPRHIYLVMELVSGGELFDRIVERGHFSEHDSATVMCALFDALAYLHANDVVHRDLKPENLLCQSLDDVTFIKIADFGLSKICGEGIVLHTACGTPGYVAPEVLKQSTGGYSSAVDLWSAGVILYILLCGFQPFYADDNRHLFRLIMDGEYDFPAPYWDVISDGARDLVERLLVVEPTQRMTAAEGLDHTWILNLADNSKEHIEGMTDRLRNHNAKRKFRKAGYAAMAIARLGVFSAIKLTGGHGATEHKTVHEDHTDSGSDSGSDGSADSSGGMAGRSRRRARRRRGRVMGGGIRGAGGVEAALADTSAAATVVATTVGVPSSGYHGLSAIANATAVATAPTRRPDRYSGHTSPSPGDGGGDSGAGSESPSRSANTRRHHRHRRR